MLVHSGGYMQPHCYYPDPTFFPQHATPPPQHFDIDAFLSHPSAYQAPSPTPASPSCQHSQPQAAFHHQHHQQQPHMQHQQSPHYNQGGCYSHHQQPSPAYGACPCGCPYKPVQETFLHKILTGKGYQNDAMRPHHHQHPHLHPAGSMDNLHCGGGGYGSNTPDLEQDFAMAASCCFASGFPSLPMSSATFPSSIPAF